jgi:hypothetical protein
VPNYSLQYIQVSFPYSFASFTVFTGSQEEDTISIGSQKEEVIEIIAYQLRDIWARVLARQLGDLGYV